jgi:hypothetical protein
MKRQDKIENGKTEDGKIGDGFWSRLADVVKKNLPSVAGELSIISTSIGTLMFFIGVTFAIMVYAKNGYLPDVNLVDVTTTLFAIGFVGLAVILSIVLVFFSSVLPIVLINPNLNIIRNRVVIILPTLLTVLYFIHIIYASAPLLSAGKFLICVLVITLICSFFSRLKIFLSRVLKVKSCAKFMSLVMSIERKFFPRTKDSWRVFFSGIVLFICLSLPIPVVLEMLSEQQGELNKILLFFSFILIWVGVNFMLADWFLNKKIEVPLVVTLIFVLPLLLSFWAGNVAMVPTATFRRLGLGEIPVTLSLTESACIALEQQTDSGSIRCQQGIVKHVMLKSRIGGWFMVEPILEKKNSGDHGDVQKFFIRKEDVKFWIRERKKNKDEAVADGAAGDAVEKGGAGEASGKSKTNSAL